VLNRRTNLDAIAMQALHSFCSLIARLIRQRQALLSKQRVSES
jgi:hypothetical protein